MAFWLLTALFGLFAQSAEESQKPETEKQVKGELGWEVAKRGYRGGGVGYWVPMEGLERWDMSKNFY